MSSATIKIFLPHGDPKRLRTAELSNWTGKAIAGPRSEFDNILKREESSNSGIYFLTGFDAEEEKPAIYIGEAESIKDRVKSHLDKDFWNQIIFFISKDENLTKSHIRYLEGRLITQAKEAERSIIKNSQGSGAKLPEADREDMEVFLEKLHQLLPALGVELLIPQASISKKESNQETLSCNIKGLKATGYLTPNGMVVLKGSQAVAIERDSYQNYKWIVNLREGLKKDGSLISESDYLIFTKNIEFTSPSAAAAVIRGGTANGLLAWVNSKNQSLKELEAT